MPAYFRLVTTWPTARVAEMEAALRSGSQHPRDIKMAVAYDITAQFYGQAGANDAQGHFKQVFQNRKLPDEMPEYTIESTLTLVDFIVQVEFAKSKSEARRLIKQNGVKLDGRTITDIDMTLAPTTPVVLQVGKRRFVRLKPHTNSE